MAAYGIKNIRNIALIGHSGEGKTTLAEAMLFNANAIDRQGRTDDGNTTMDFDQEEIARKISISLALANFVYEGTKINLIDVPGFFDFEGEFNQAMSVADSALVVAGANGTLTVGTEKAIDYCIEHNKPALIFINQMDKENANYFGTVNALKEKYGTKIAPIQFPVVENQKMQGYINIVEGKAYEFGSHGKKPLDIPANLVPQYEELRSHIEEVAAESDDSLLEKFFEGVKLTQEEISEGARKGIAHGLAIPVLAGSALMNRGIFNLMHQLIVTMPDPTETNAQVAVDSSGKTISVESNDSQPFSARVFKTITDAFVGKLSLLKVITGTLKSGMSVENVNQGKTEKISGMFFLKGKKQEPTDVIGAGDIGALSKLQYTVTGDTLCDASRQITYPAIELPEPVISMAIYATKKGDEEKIFAGLHKLQDEDSCFDVFKNLETGEMLISGIGETQLDILCKKLKNKFGAEAELREPKIAYRETIRKVVSQEGKHKKQSGGAGQYGHCFIRFEPYPDGDFMFDEEVVGGTVPRQYIPAVEKGLREAILHGVLAGYPMVNLKAVLYDGSSHPVDSKEIAYKMAASYAYKDGCLKASPCLLEPIFELKISVPESYMGDVLGDLNRRRGRILGMNMENGRQVINAEVPQGEILRYATDLRSMTQGRGKFVSKLTRYEEVPATSSTKIIETAKRDAEAAKE